MSITKTAVINYPKYLNASSTDFFKHVVTDTKRYYTLEDIMDIANRAGCEVCVVPAEEIGILTKTTHNNQITVKASEEKYYITT